MRRVKNTENNTQSIKRFLMPQSPAIVKKRRRKDTTNGDQNCSRIGGLASSKETEFGREKPKNNESSKSNDGGKAQNASNTEASGIMPAKKVDWNSLLMDHRPLCETRYPVTFNTFKTMTYCENAVRKFLEDIKQDTGIDFLHDDAMQERAVRNYYKYFYERPQIRDVYKLEIKACPTFVKTNILKIPNKLDAEKVLGEDCQDFNPYPDRSCTTVHNGDQNSNMVGGLASSTDCNHERLKNNESSKTNAGDKAQNPRITEASGIMPIKKNDWNRLVTDHEPLCETRYPVTFNTFKTMTYCENAVRKFLEDIKQDTGIDFLHDAAMQERAMRNYYRYFYEQPQIREVYKLEIKACPTFLKKNILHIPNKLDAEKAISTNTDPTVPLEPAAHAEILCPLKEPQTAAVQSTKATHKVLSQQNATSQTKRQTNILRISKMTMPNDTAFLLRHIKRHVQDTEKQQTILERFKCEVLRTQCNPQEIVQNVYKEKLTDAEQYQSSSSESIVINVVKQRLQQVKDLYFREYVKSNLLPYALRMCKGLKRQIIITILKITFEEFTKYTHIYNGAEIYEDSELLGGYYDYAIKEPQIWPINLYMNLEDLCEFLKSKGIAITKQNLKDIPPILLHWEELAALTSFDKIARWDYYRCRGEKLNKEDTQSMNAYRKVFYAKCWHHNTWLRMVPQVLQGVPATNDEPQKDAPKPISKESVREQEVSTDVERRADVVEKGESEKTLENAKCLTKNAADTAERDQPADASGDCEMPDVSAKSKSTALDTGIQNQASVGLIEEERIGLCTEEGQPESSQTTTGTATSIALLDSQLFSDLSVQDIAIEQRLQGGKELYFKEVAKSCTLPYILRCYRGLKRRIIAAILNMTFTEFQQYTNIYDGAEIYKDTQLLKRCYDYTFKAPQVWPVNLYMRLGDLFQFLQTKQITLTASDLQFVSPKFLHWKDLIATTNYNYIVYWDYYRNSGKQFDSRNTTLNFYYQAFYAKCWHLDKWVWHTPRILPDVLSVCGVAVCVAADDNENIAFERKVVLHALKRQQVAEVSESTVTGVVEHTGQTHAVAVVDVEIQTTQGLQEAIRPKEIMTSVGNTTEASVHNVREKVATVDAEIQTTRNLLEPTHAANTHIPAVMQNSIPCPPLPACAIKEEKLTPLNKLEFNLTADDGDNYECVEAPDDVINLETTAVLSQMSEEMLLPLSNSENLDTNNFNNLLSELHDVQSTQKSSEQQEIERSLEQAIRYSHENSTQRGTTVEVNQSQAQSDLAKEAQSVTQQPVLGNKNSNNISKQLPTKQHTTMSQTRKIIPPSQTTQKSVQKQQQAMEKQTALAELTNETQIMSQLQSKSQATQQQSTSAAKEINAEDNLLLMESIVDAAAASGSQLKRTPLKSAEQQALNKQMEEAFVQQEQLIADEERPAELTQICEDEASAQGQLQQRHEETPLVDELSAEMVAVVEQTLVEEEGEEDIREVERPAEPELVTTQLQQNAQHFQQQQQQQEQQQQNIQQQQQQHIQQQQQIQLQLNKIKEQEKKLELQLKRHHQQGKKLYLQLKQHQQQVQQLQIQQQQFQQMLLQPKQEVSNSQSTLIEQLKQAKDQQQQQQATLKNPMQQQTQTTPKQTMQQQQKPTVKQSAQVHQRHQQNAQKQKLPTQTGSQETTDIQQQKVVLEQQETLAIQESIESEHQIEEQPQQQEQVATEHSVQVDVQQYEEISQEKEKQHTQGLFEELIEEITTENNSPELHIVEQQNSPTDPTSENSVQIEEQSQQQEQVAIAHSIQAYVRQYEQETQVKEQQQMQVQFEQIIEDITTEHSVQVDVQQYEEISQEKEKQHTQGLFEELIEEITTENNSPELHIVEQQNSPTDPTSENSIQIEQQSQQQEQVAIAHSIQAYVRQYEQETQVKEQQQMQVQFEQIIEEITTAYNSPEVHIDEQQNSGIETSSENSFLGDEANTEFVATEFLQQQLIVTPQQQYATAEQQQQTVEQQQNENEQQNSLAQQPQIILQRTRTHVQEQFMFGPTITSTQAMTTSNRTQARVSKQHMTATTTTKTKTARAAKTKTATTKRKVTTKTSDYVPQLTHVFPALPVALNNKKMSPGTQAPTTTTANIITLPNTCNQLVPVVNEQTVMPKTATPQNAMLLTLPAATSTAAKNTSSANHSSYVYGLSGDSTLFNGTQLVQIIEQYQLQNRQTTQQQHDLQPIQTMQQQLQLLPQTNEQQAQYVDAQPQLLQLQQQASYRMQQQQQLQVFQQSTIEQQRLQQMSPPSLVPLQTNNAAEQQQLYVQAAQHENEQLLQQAQEQHVQTQYVLEQVQQGVEQQQYEIHQKLELQHEPHEPHEPQAQHEPPQVQLDNQQQQPYQVLTTTPYQPLIYQLLDVTQTLQDQQQPTQYHYQQEQQEHYIQLAAEIGIEDTHIIEYKDEQELEQILLQVNISVEHNYSKSAPKSTLPSKLLDAPKLTSPSTKANGICRMRPNMLRKPFFFRQLETLDYFSQVTATNIADYQLQCISIDQPYLQAKIRTSHMRTLVVFDGDMLTFLLPRCTPTLLQDLSIVLQYLGQFHYNMWEQRQQRKLISKCTHRTLHTLCAQILLVFFSLSSPFQTQNECLNLACDGRNFEQRNFFSAAAAARRACTPTRPAVTLDNLSLAIEPSILEEMAALRCNL